MRKTYMGVQLRRLREERGLTQVALARTLGLSASYLNQIEQNQRPLTVPVLLKINAVFGVDVQHFSEGDEARLIAGLRDVLADLPPGAPADAVSLAEVRELAANMPAVARVLLALHRGRAEARERLEALAAHYGDERGGAVSTAQTPPMAYEEVRDFFFARHNHIAELDDAAEHLAAQWRLAPGAAGAALQARLEQAHGVRVALLQGGDGDEAGEGAAVQRRFDAAARVLYLSPTLQGAQRAFQMATQLAFLEVPHLLQHSVQGAALSGEAARTLARIGLANYFAGALLLPYGAFLRTAEALHYDIKGDHSMISSWGGMSPPKDLNMVKPIERVLHSGLFGPWDRPDIKGILPDELPPAVNPARQPTWGQDSFEFFPNWTLLLWVPGWYLTYNYWPTGVDSHIFEANLYFVPPKNTRQRLSQDLAAVTFKEYALQDANTLEATQTQIGTRAVTEFPLCDQEVLLRHLHHTAHKYVDAYKAEQAEKAANTNGSVAHV